tara:strand:- start:24 stop:128 length:105 start_codon:yes stop_codon:yes gene_type:complete
MGPIVILMPAALHLTIYTACNLAIVRGTAGVMEW